MPGSRLLSWLAAAILLCNPVSAQVTNGLTVTGNLSQAFAQSTEHQVFGINTEFSSAYRVLNLQFGYSVSERNDLIIQLSHRKLGASPFAETEPNVDLDWGYFTYQFTPGFGVEIGKLPAPIGLMNRKRDQSLLLPFYQVPYAFYGLNPRLNETVDGSNLRLVMGDQNGWRADLQAFAGFWRFQQARATSSPDPNAVDYDLSEHQVSNGFGTQVWLVSPWTHSRIGGGFFSGNETTAEPESRFWAAHSSLETAMFFFRFCTEWIYFTNPDQNEDQSGLYAQIQVPIRKVVTLNGIFQKSWLGLTPQTGEKTWVDGYQEFGFGAKVNFSSQFIVKAEYHLTEGFAVEDVVLKPLSQSPFQTQYWIISLSAGF